jgi:hypothetical protein
MTLKDIIKREKKVKDKAIVVGQNAVTTVQKKQAERIKKRAQDESAEAKRLNKRLKDLKVQKKKEDVQNLSKARRDKKRKQIAELESKYTTKGKILTELSKDATILGREVNKAAGILGNEAVKLIQSNTPKKSKRRRRKKS